MLLKMLCLIQQDCIFRSESAALALQSDSLNWTWKRA